MKVKKFIPAANYEIIGNLTKNGHKSNIEKAKRNTLADDIAAF
jgi:hypothetical protein